jgi:hypothetical protein
MEGEAGTSSTPMAVHAYEPFDVAEQAIGTSLSGASAPPKPLAPLRLTKNDDEPQNRDEVCFASIGMIVSHYFRCVRRLVADAENADDDLQRENAALSIILAVSAIEAFLNIWFRTFSQEGPPAATGRKFTVRRSDVRSPHENRYLAIFQTAGKSG